MTVVVSDLHAILRQVSFATIGDDGWGPTLALSSHSRPAHDPRYDVCVPDDCRYVYTPRCSHLHVQATAPLIGESTLEFFDTTLELTLSGLLTGCHAIIDGLELRPTSRLRQVFWSFSSSSTFSSAPSSQS